MDLRLEFPLCDSYPARLDGDEEIALAHRVHGLDRADAIAARNELVLCNLGLVGRVVRTFVRRRPARDPDDLFSEGLVALLHAAARYDPDTHHTRFTTIAFPSIHKHLWNYTASETLVRVPTYLQSPARLGRWRSRPRPGPLLDAAAAARREMTSLSLIQLAHEGDNPAIPLAPDAPAEGVLIRRDLIGHVRRACDRLPMLQARVIRRLFGVGCKPYTRRELAWKMRLSLVRIRTLEGQARARLSRELARFDPGHHENRWRYACPHKS